MKIGIMSMQRVMNYGSFLQAYGLKRIIESMGHEVVFIDYHQEAPLVSVPAKRGIHDVLNKFNKLAKMISADYRLWRRNQIRLNETFDLFCLEYNSKWLSMLGISETRNYCEELDVLVIGSDEVFNCTQEGETVGYSRELFGKDNKAHKLISYAASFGSTTIEKLEQYKITNEIAELLSYFDNLSVRDTNSALIVKTLTGRNAQLNIDPVLLYSFPEVASISIDIKDYIIVYAYADRLTDEEASAVRSLAKKTGKKLISLGYWQTFCDEYILASPLEVLAYIREADFVITDTFHGTVFSIIMNKQFGTIIRDSNTQKLSGLLKQFGLEGQEVRQLSKLEQIVSQPIDYVQINAILQEEKHKSMKYFQDILIKS